MFQVSFSDGKKYSLALSDFALGEAVLHYEDTGDRHGNNNIRSAFHKPTAEQIVELIAPEIADQLLAVTIDGVLSSIDTPISKDCTLEPVLFDHEEGQTLYYRTMAFLLAECIEQLMPDAALDNIESDRSVCKLFYRGKTLQQLDPAIVVAHFVEISRENKATLYRDIWPKDMLESTFPSIKLDINQKRLECYDEFESVPVILHEQFALVLEEKENVYIRHPQRLRLSKLQIEQYDEWQIITAY